MGWRDEAARRVPRDGESRFHVAVAFAAIGRSKVAEQIHRQERQKADQEADDECMSPKHGH